MPEEGASDDEIVCYVKYIDDSTLAKCYMLASLTPKHSYINSKSLAFGYLDEKSIDTGLMKFLRAAGELDYFSAHIHLREPGKSEDKAECKSMDNRATGLAAPWYRRVGTSVESSIPCSHGGRALVVKGVEEVENAKANSKYQDRTEGQRPRNFIRLVSMDFSSR
ncbi:hypothetical protein B296_00006626 [Ensete ventricosum]|uniref:Uncharacterized protein n=1 Tax=Ensete ventricosum TaxID=4639 RepID=A0A427AGW5_ENSVE|nr:hypothetical protein B296_00006626 [Ensete ventricosum]